MPSLFRFAKIVLLVSLMATSIAFADDDPLDGYWGGDDVSLFTANAGADGNFYCSSGRILQPIHLDDQDHFSVTGYIDFYEGGAHGATRVAAIFSGVVRKKQMQMRIELENGVVWVFNLLRGDLGKVKKCR